MRFNFKKLFALPLLFGVFLFAACSGEEDDVEKEATGEITNLLASLSTDNGRIVSLQWDKLAEKAGYENYKVYRAEEGGEFSKVASESKAKWTDRSTVHGKSYKYYVAFEQMKSKTVEVATDHPNKPFVGGYAQVAGEGTAAELKHIFIRWFVGSDKEVEKYEIYRDNNLVQTITASYEDEWRDFSSDLKFDTEYSYKVVVKTNSGESLESDLFQITPRRPDEKYREAPEVVKVKSNYSDKSIQVHIKDVSETPYNLIGFYGELEGLNAVVESEFKVEELQKDEEGNLIIKVDASDVTLPTGQTIWFKSKVKIHVSGGWSEWSAYNRSFVF